MPEKLIPSSTSSSPGILPMRQIARKERKKVNLTWLCCGICLIALVLIGFASLIRNFLGHWPRVDTSFLGGSSTQDDDSSLPIYPYLGNGHSYDTKIPGEDTPSVVREEVAKEEFGKPSTIADRDRDRDLLFSENSPVQLNIIRREEWKALPPKRKTFLSSFANEKAIILETGTETCYNRVSRVLKILTRGSSRRWI